MGTVTKLRIEPPTEGLRPRDGEASFPKCLLTYRSVLLVCVALATACTVKQDKVPPLTGPSEFGQSVNITATPDSISQDGASQSAIVVFVRGPNGAGLSGVSLRLQIVVGGSVQDYGTLSAKTIATGSDGRASSIYTAPPPPPPPANGQERRVSIIVTATGSNFQTAVSHTADIRLVPTGIILPPTQTPNPSFTYSPQPVLVNLPVNFDATATCGGSTCAAAGITSFQWNFGDGSTASGQTTTKTFDSNGSFNVTLTVTNARGISASTTQIITIGTGAEPTAEFVFSPTTPQTLDVVSFNASASRAGPGRTIRRYDWNFGDNDPPKTGVTTTHDFSAAGTYNVVLTVTDDLDQRGTTSQPVTVSAAGGGGGGTTPTASFFFSPTSPQVGQNVQFNGDASRAGTGHNLVNYSWNFGDGSTVSSATSLSSHSFTAVGTYQVVLTVTDEIGQRASTTPQSVTVTAAGAGGTTLPTASFVRSPASPGVGETVFFNASTSSGGQGHTITSYSWAFGDGSTGSGVTVTHAYTTAGNYSVLLTVTNDIGQTDDSTVDTITVGSPPAPTANFTFSPALPGRNDEVVFDASSSTTAQGQTIVDVAWNFGDGTAVVHCPGDPACVVAVPPTNRVSSHTYATPQTFRVNLVVTDSAGRIGQSSRDVIVDRAEPVVQGRITASPNPANPGGTVSFNSSGVVYWPGSGPVTYAWSFGDGVGSTLANPTHIYSAIGTYTAGLSVTDSKGRTGTGTVSVSVVNPTPPPPPTPPVASFTFGSANPRTPTTVVTFDGGGSTGANPLEYTWNFGDGIIEGPFLTSTRTHTYVLAGAGSYSVTLRVEDTVTGASNTSAAQTVTVVP